MEELKMKDTNMYDFIEGDRVITTRGDHTNRKKGILPKGTIIRFLEYNGYPAALVEKDLEFVGIIRTKKRVFLLKNLKKENS